MRRTLARLTAAAVIPLVALAAATPASAEVKSLVITPNTAAPGGTVSVSAVFVATGWTSGVVAVYIQVPDGVATFALPPQPSWAISPCQLSVNSRTLACDWQPFDESSQVQLVADLTVASTTPAGTIPVLGATVIAGVQPNATATAPLLVTPAPTVSPTVTPTPTGTATPTPTGTATIDPGNTAVPTAVPAGEGPLDPPSGGMGAVWLAVIAAVGVAVAGSVALARRGRRQG